MEPRIFDVLRQVEPTPDRPAVDAAAALGAGVPCLGMPEVGEMSDRPTPTTTVPRLPVAVPGTSTVAPQLGRVPGCRRRPGHRLDESDPGTDRTVAGDLARAALFAGVEFAVGAKRIARCGGSWAVSARTTGSTRSTCTVRRSPSPSTARTGGPRPPGFGLLAGLLSVVGLWFTRRRARRPVPRWSYRATVVALVTPFAANSAGWIFTEMGRQPWAVYGVLRTADGVSPSVGAGTVLLSLIVLTLLYGVLAVIDGVLMVRYAKAGPPPPAAPVTDANANANDEPRPLAVAY